MLVCVANRKHRLLYSNALIFSLLAVLLLSTACSKNQSELVNPSLLLTMSLSSSVKSYSLLNEFIEFEYQVTNNGDVTLAGPVSVNNSLRDAFCPDLATTGNKDLDFQPGESLLCTSSYTVTQADLKTGYIANSATANVAELQSSEVAIIINSIAESLFVFPFDTTDPGVVFRSALNSPDAILQAGGTEEAGSLNEFDSVLGMKPGAGINGAPGCRFMSASITGLASLPSGQLSIEVEREWLAITNSEVGSVGYDHSVIEYLLSFGPAGIGTLGRLYMQPDESLLLRFIPGEGTRRAHFVNSNKSSRFARVTLSWDINKVSFYVDGLLMGEIDRIDKNDNRFSNVFLGTLGGVGVNGFESTYYMRNLIVSNKPVVPWSEPLLRHIMHIGDSFAAGLPLFNTPGKYDGTIVNTVIRELFEKGISYGKYTVYSNGGGKIQDSSNDPLEIDVNGGGKTRFDALTDDPSLIVFITGGNDLDVFQEDLFTADLHDHIEAFLGVNGYAHTNVQHVIITTTTSNLSASSSNLLAMRDIMLGLPDWWDTTYPSLSGRVRVVDMWSIFGGINVDHSLFGITDKIHPSAAGNILYGRSIANEIFQLVK